MGYLLASFSLLGGIVCIIGLIVQAIRWGAKKPFVLGFLACIVLFFIGLALIPTSDKSTENTGKEEEQLPEEKEESPSDSSGISQEGKEGVLLGDTVVFFENHSVTSGIGNNYLFDIKVGTIEKELMKSVSSDELTAFLNALDFTGTNGNIVLMFEDGTGLSIMDAAKNYCADYGYIDVSEGEFGMTERLGTIWNDTGSGWYYMTEEEMREADGPAESADTPESGQMSLESVANVFEIMLSESYSGCKVTTDDAGINVDIWSDGLALSVAALHMSGEGADNKDWVTAKNSVVELSKTMMNTMESTGNGDEWLVINVLNDQNKENVLLTTMNSVIVYDVLAQ